MNSQLAVKTCSCPSCWASKHECKRAPTGCCRRCKAQILKGVNDSPASIQRAQPFYNALVYQELYKHPPLRYLPSLDCQKSDSSALDLRISMANTPAVSSLVRFSGPFTPQNHSLVEHFDHFISLHFSAKLEAKGGESRLIPTASLAGGYLQLLCSVSQTTEYVQTSRNGLHVENEYSGYNLEAHYKYFLVCRLRELIDIVLNAIRLEDPLNQYPYWCSNAYAAAVILRSEVEHFKCSLRNGSLQNYSTPGLRELLLNWFTSVELELIERIREGCGRFPNWRSAIKGSMKNSRRHVQSCAIAMHLHLIHADPLIQQCDNNPFPYTLQGVGQSMLLPLDSPHPLSGDQPLARWESIGQAYDNYDNYDNGSSLYVLQGMGQSIFAPWGDLQLHPLNDDRPLSPWNAAGIDDSAFWVKPIATLSPPEIVFPLQEGYNHASANSGKPPEPDRLHLAMVTADPTNYLDPRCLSNTEGYRGQPNV